MPLQDTQVSSFGGKMQVLIINGSPRKNGITAAVLHRIEENLRKVGIDVLFYNLEEMKMSHCTGCNYCYRALLH